MITPEAQAAEDDLWAKGALRGKRMKVELDLSNEDDWALVARYASWSINVDAYDNHDAHIGTP